MRASLVCGEPGCPRPAVRAGFCELHRRRTVEGHARDRRRARLVARDGERCADCGTTRRVLVQSHEVPLSHGGQDDDRNVVLRCGSCHRRHDARFGIGFGGSAAGEV